MSSSRDLATAELPPYNQHGDMEMAHLLAGELLAEPNAFLAEQNARRASGRYYLTEAAELLIVETGEAPVSDAVVTANAVRLLEAGRRGELTLRDPNTNLPIARREMTSLARVVTLADLNGWLESSGSGYRVEPAVADGVAAPLRALPRMRDTENRVLQALRARGFDPERLPALPKGKAWPPREEIRVALGLTKAQIDHAWKALRKDDRIRDA